MCSRRLRNRLANQAMDQTPHRAARASLAALVIAERYGQPIAATGQEQAEGRSQHPLGIDLALDPRVRPESHDRR